MNFPLWPLIEWDPAQAPHEYAGGKVIAVMAS